MKMVKSLLLGTAAGFVVVAGAQAADMPLKARPVQYVKICTLYGDGYYYIPGSDTCIKIGGFVQLDLASGGTANAAINYSGSAGAQDRTVSQLSSRAYIQVAIDTRTQTQYGTLRTLNVFKILNQAESESTNAIRNFIQWAGFTIGRMDSFTNTWQYNDSYGLAQPQVGHDDSWGSNGVNAIAYTFEFGNGVTLTFAADERTKKNITDLSVNSVLKVGADPTDFTGGNTWYDPFVSGRIDQAWGYLSANVGLHDNNATYYTESGTAASLATTGVPGYTCTAAGFGGGVGAANSVISSCGHPSDKIGWFAEAGGEIKLPFLGSGDKAGASVGYSQGASKFGSGNNISSAGLFDSGNRLALTYMTDSVYANGAGLELTTAWRVQAGYVHSTIGRRPWTPISMRATRKFFMMRRPKPTSAMPSGAPRQLPAPPCRRASTSSNSAPRERTAIPTTRCLSSAPAPLGRQCPACCSRCRKSTRSSIPGSVATTCSWARRAPRPRAPSSLAPIVRRASTNMRIKASGRRTSA